jgi:peptide/nickel transport system substrate-binding protein
LPSLLGSSQLSRHVRWQAILAFLGILLVIALLSYATYTYTSQEVPARGGVFVEGVAGNPQYINPILCQYNEVDRDLCALIFNGLLKLDERGAWQPDLAESWEMGPNSDVYTFTLRSDSRWHDGLRITADDVLFTVQLMQDPDLPVLPDLAELWRSVIATKTDERTVVFHLSQPYAAFPDYVTLRWFGVIPKHYWERYAPAEIPNAQLNTQPIGSGRFKLVEMDSQHARLEPVLSQFDTTPYLDALEFRFYPDYPSILAAAEAGEVHGVSHILPEYQKQAESIPDLQLFTAPTPGYTMVLFNFDAADAPGLKEQPVRQALAYALNRDKLLSEIIPGVGLKADSPILPDSWAYNPNAPRYPYNPERAQKLLEEAGWIDGNKDGVREKDGHELAFTLLSDDAPHSIAITQAMVEDWGRIGVRVTPQPVSFTGMVTDFLSPRHFDAALISVELIGDPDPYPQWHSSQISPKGQNFGGWQSREADILMEQARLAGKQEMRRQLYYEFQNIFATELPAILLYYPLLTYGASAVVHDMAVGNLNEPADRFATFAHWYINTRKITRTERRTLNLDKVQNRE